MKLDKDTYVVVCEKNDGLFVLNMRGEIGPNDRIVNINMGKFPTRNLEKIYFEYKKFDYMILVNNNARYYDTGFISDFKKRKVEDGIVYKKLDDLVTLGDFKPMSSKLVDADDSICIPLKIFKGFRDINPLTTLPDVIKKLSIKYTPYGDQSRLVSAYDVILKEKRVKEESGKVIDNDYWIRKVENVRLQDEGILMIPKIIEKVNANSNIGRGKYNKIKDINTKWNDWMFD